MNMLPGKSNLVAKQNVDTRDITGPDFGSVPYVADALHYSFTPAIDGELKDRTGLSDRDSVMTKKIVGDGNAYAHSKNIISKTIFYYDIDLGTEIESVASSIGIWKFPMANIAYFRIGESIFSLDSIDDTAYSKIVSVDGEYILELKNVDDTVILDSFHGLCICDKYGYSISDGEIYMDSLGVIPYESNRKIQPLYENGEYSKVYCNGYIRIYDTLYVTSDNYTYVTSDGFKILLA